MRVYDKDPSDWGYEALMMVVCANLQYEQAWARIGMVTEIPAPNKARILAPQQKSIFTDEQLEEMRALRAEGLYFNQIAERFKCSTSTVYRNLKGYYKTWEEDRREREG